MYKLELEEIVEGELLSKHGKWGHDKSRMTITHLSNSNKNIKSKEVKIL